MSFFLQLSRSKKTSTSQEERKKNLFKKNCAPFVLDAVLGPQRRLLLQVPQRREVVGRVRRHRGDDAGPLRHRDRQQRQHKDRVVRRARRRERHPEQLLARDRPDWSRVGVGTGGEEVLVGHVAGCVPSDDVERGRRRRLSVAAVTTVAGIAAAAAARGRRRRGRRRSSLVDPVLTRRQRPAVGLPEHRLGPQRGREQEDRGPRVRLGELGRDGRKAAAGAAFAIAASAFGEEELVGLDAHLHQAVLLRAHALTAGPVVVGAGLAVLGAEDGGALVLL